MKIKIEIDSELIPNLSFKDDKFNFIPFKVLYKSRLLIFSSSFIKIQIEYLVGPISFIK